MAFANDFFAANLIARLDSTGVYLPICDTARADLLRILKNNTDYTWASLVNDTAMETVKITNDYGELLLTRGQAGTTALNHPPGTCVRTVSPTVVAVIKEFS